MRLHRASTTRDRLPGAGRTMPNDAAQNQADAIGERREPSRPLRCVRTRAGPRNHRAPAASKQRHRRLVRVALQARLLDAPAEAAEAVRGRVQHARRCRFTLAQHEHTLAVAEAADRTGEAGREALLDGAHRERAQGAAVPLPAAIRRARRAMLASASVRRNAPSGSSAANRQQGGHQGAPVTRPASRRTRAAGNQRAGASRPPFINIDDRRAHRRQHANRPIAWCSASRSSPCGRASSATSTLLRSTLPASTSEADERQPQRGSVHRAAPTSAANAAGAEVRHPDHLHAGARRVDDHELPVHLHGRAGCVRAA